MVDIKDLATIQLPKVEVHNKSVNTPYQLPVIANDPSYMEKIGKNLVVEDLAKGEQSFIFNNGYFPLDDKFWESKNPQIIQIQDALKKANILKPYCGRTLHIGFLNLKDDPTTHVKVFTSNNTSKFNALEQSLLINLLLYKCPRTLPKDWTPKSGFELIGAYVKTNAQFIATKIQPVVDMLNQNSTTIAVDEIVCMIIGSPITEKQNKTDANKKDRSLFLDDMWFLRQTK